jgi:hypothetical protein
MAEIARTVRIRRWINAKRGKIFSGSRQNVAVAGDLRSIRANSGGLTRRTRPEMPMLWAFLWITRFAQALAVKSPITIFQAEYR